MKIGLLGTGHQGRKYIDTFAKMGLELDWASRLEKFDADAVIIATPAQTHYELAKTAMSHGCHVLIEKPMVMDANDAKRLLDLAMRMEVVGFVGHTHLYSPAWREIKAQVGAVKHIRSECGGPCKIDPLFDWGSHDVAMRIDIAGKDCPHDMKITAERIKRKFEIVTADKTFLYDDPPTNPRPLEVMIREFIEACEKSQPDTRGIELGVQVAEVLCA